jgi:hypothetical protein
MRIGKRAFLVLFVTVAVQATLTAQTASESGADALSHCPDPLAVLRRFYDSNDALRFEESALLFADDADFATWATGVNGHIMAERHLKGRMKIRGFLPNGRGLRRRLPDAPPDGPVYSETRIQVTGSTVRFMLEPDRKRPNGRLYNPFSVEAVLDGCRIKSLTVIEQVTWL